MHAAPPVRLSFAPDRAWQVFVVLCACAAGANVTAWAVLHGQGSVQVAVLAALLAGACAGLLAWRCVLRRSQATDVLAWDGAIWQWSAGAAAPCPGDLRVMADLGGWVLLRFAPTSRARPPTWLAMSRRQGGAQWPIWRAALYARRPGATLPSTYDLT